MKKVSVELTAETGGFISSMNAARQQVQEMDKEIKKLRSSGDHMGALKMEVQRDALHSSTRRVEQNTKQFFSQGGAIGAHGLPAMKMDTQMANAFKNLTAQIQKLANKYVGQMQSGNRAGADETLSMIHEKNAELNKRMDVGKKDGGSLGDLGKTLGKAFAGIATAQFVANAFSSIMQGSAKHAMNEAEYSRTAGIISALGSGNLASANYAEYERQTQFKLSTREADYGIWTSILSAIPILGDAANSVINLDKAKKDSADLKKLYEQEAENTKIQLWREQVPGALDLSANMNNPADVRGNWDIAADTAARYGFRAEEGLSIMTESARQGLADLAGSIANDIFAYQRSYGADRESLSAYANKMGRFGGESSGVSLANSTAALNLSGMKAGQHNEMLRAMERVMESGISKGFARSSKDIGENLSWLATVGGGSELWKGEQGANKWMQMEQGIESAKNLSDPIEMLNWRSAAEVLRNRLGREATRTEIEMLVEKPDVALAKQIQQNINSMYTDKDDRNSAAQKAFGFRTMHETVAFMNGANSMPVNITGHGGLRDGVLSSADMNRMKDDTEAQVRTIRTGREGWDKGSVAYKTKIVEEQMKIRFEEEQDYREALDKYNGNWDPNYKYRSNFPDVLSGINIPNLSAAPPPPDLDKDVSGKNGQQDNVIATLLQNIGNKLDNLADQWNKIVIDVNNGIC